MTLNSTRVIALPEAVWRLIETRAVETDQSVDTALSELIIFACRPKVAEGFILESDARA